MKKTILSVIALSALAMLAGCKKENKENGKAAFKASIEQQAAPNRTSLEPGADNQAEIFWTTGDQINIINAGGTPTIGTLQTGAGSTEGSFSVDENYDLTGPYKAVYPSSGTFSGNTLTLVLPETQNLAGASATFANGANPMVAVSDDENLGFKNLCGCLGLSLTGNNVHITSIKITDADGQKLNGTFTADCTANEPVLVYTGTDGSADVTLTCDTTLTAESTQFFIVLPVGALAHGFTMDIYDGGTTPIFSQSTTTATTIARNQVNVMNELPVTPAPADEHEYVDLGLPSGQLWATCNVGADSPEGYGGYFAWGETQTKDTYYWNTYAHGTENALTKYCTLSDYGLNGFTDNLTTLESGDDVATVLWGADWRMPTKEEWEELLNNTTHTMTTQGGVVGRLFTATNGNTLFLPAAGYYQHGNLDFAGIVGEYWSNLLKTDLQPVNNPDNQSNATYLYFTESDNSNCHMSYTCRCWGLPVRAVRAN